MTSEQKAKAPANPWVKWGLVVVAVVVALAMVVLVAKSLRGMPAVQDFIASYPGDGPMAPAAPEGFPVWMNVQHFLNMFLMVLLIKAGWAVRTNTKPGAYVTPNRGPFAWLGAKKKISLDLWFHLVTDALWLLNGIVFVILLFATGHWKRIVPASWDVFPNAISVGLQYASLDMPVENSWIHYNALQMLAYFVIVFIAAPLAFITGVRMSGAWPAESPINKFYPIEVARAIHFPTMLFFVLFIVSHVIMVMSTGAVHNLNHMFAANPGDGLWGVFLFIGAVIITVAGVFLARPLFLRPIAQLTGNVTKR